MKRAEKAYAVAVTVSALPFPKRPRAFADVLQQAAKDAARECAEIAEMERRSWDEGRVGRGVAATIKARIIKRFKLKE